MPKANECLAKTKYVNNQFSNWTTFNTRYNIEEASKRFALERYGASVLHVLLVAEYGVIQASELLQVYVVKDLWRHKLLHVDNQIMWQDTDFSPNVATEIVIATGGFLRKMAADLTRVIMTEKEQFDAAMDLILKADPKFVKEQMEEDTRQRVEARKAKRASSVPASSDHD